MGRAIGSSARDDGRPDVHPHAVVWGWVVLYGAAYCVEAGRNQAVPASCDARGADEICMTDFCFHWQLVPYTRHVHILYLARNMALILCQIVR